MNQYNNIFLLKLVSQIIHLTGASSLPVKNFLIDLAATICAGVTAGSFTQGLPAKKKSIDQFRKIHHKLKLWTVGYLLTYSPNNHVKILTNYI